MQTNFLPILFNFFVYFFSFWNFEMNDRWSRSYFIDWRYSWLSWFPLIPIVDTFIDHSTDIFLHLRVALKIFDKKNIYIYKNINRNVNLQTFSTLPVCHWQPRNEQLETEASRYKMAPLLAQSVLRSISFSFSSWILRNTLDSNKKYIHSIIIQQHKNII